VLTEERLIPGTSAADIEPEAFRTMMRRRGVALDEADEIPWEVDLLNREVLGEDLDGTLRATLYGLMCFGKDPQRPRPTRSCFVDLVAYAGCDRADPVLLAAEGRGRLEEQVARAEAFIRSLGRQERYAGLHREDIYVVPLPVFRECVVNAVAHRDYAIRGSRVLCEVFDDRVVVTSPGSLPNHKRPASVLAGGAPRSRNESMADHLLRCGLMEQRGSGYPRMRRAMKAFNGTEPILENDPEDGWVRVTLWRVPPPR
jgi:ATP-dependent DNA helicase RecG